MPNPRPNRRLSKPSPSRKPAPRAGKPRPSGPKAGQRAAAGGARKGARGDKRTGDSGAGSRGGGTTGGKKTRTSKTGSGRGNSQRPASRPAKRATRPAAAPRKPSTAPAHMHRLQRVMADAGVASRRACEELIERGAVEVNGEVVTDLPIFVDPREDRILVEGRPLPKLAGAGERGGKGGRGAGAVRHIYVMLNKPERTLTTVTDEREFRGEGGGRRTVLDLVNHPAKARLYPVGRLDYATRGLVLLTNDGELANKLTHPSYGVHKTYEAVVKGVLPEDALDQLEKGIYLAERKEGRTVGAKRTAHVDLKIVKRERERTTVEITLREGRNRQVRRMFAGIGHPVKKLTRVGMGPLKLKGVAMGAWRELDAREVNALKKAARVGSASA